MSNKKDPRGGVHPLHYTETELARIALKFRVEWHYTSGMGVFGLRTGYDDWVLYGIWHGLERNECENV